jgi:hypothetical protein
MEISLRYAWIYKSLPTCFKWAAMAAIASHHVRLALVPLRLDADRTGYIDIERSRGRRRTLLADDVDTIRATNNDIFDDIFWVHLAYVSAHGGIDLVRDLLRTESRYAPLLAGFEVIDEGRRVLADQTASAAAWDAARARIWEGNVLLLQHEQRSVVQPNFDRLSCTSARLLSIGSATTFEVRGVRREAAYFTSFYISSFRRGLPQMARGRGWPRITRYEDRWLWLVSSVVPRFRRLETYTNLIVASLERVVADARTFLSMPCVQPHATDVRVALTTPAGGVARDTLMPPPAMP